MGNTQGSRWEGGHAYKVCFQPLEIVSLTASLIWCYMEVYGGVGVASYFWTRLVWAEQPMPGSFGVLSHCQFHHR